jgi:transcriptional regulator with XRE-family HTH domain
MAMHQSNNRLSLLGQVLKEYRKSHGLTQEQLAKELRVEPRTLRSWENERPLENIRELRRIADTLGLDYERLGLSSSLYIPRTLEQADEAIEQGWSYLQQLRYVEGRAFVEKLVRDISLQITSEDPQWLSRLASARHVAGHITSESSRTEKVPTAFQHYHEMENIARLLKDNLLLNIALTYEGDMLRRQGYIDEAISYLERARDIISDAEARGNTLQLLGRAFMAKRDIQEFENAMAEATELGTAPHTGLTKGLYNLGAVYEEYGKSYGWVGQTTKGLEYLDLAEKHLPATPHWGLVMKTARSMALIRGGDITNGGKLAIEATILCYQTNNYRMLERVFTIERYLEEKAHEYGQVQNALNGALKGQVERI